jgi:hypothetical protein
MGKFKIQKSATVNVGFDYNSSLDGTIIGGTGGNTSITGSQVVVQANLAVAHGDGYIVNGRGKNKFLISNGNVSATCVLVNKAGASLKAGEMSIQAYEWQGGPERNFYVSRMSNKFVWDFSEPLPQKYLWTGGEAISQTGSAPSDPTLPYAIVHIPLA